MRFSGRRWKWPVKVGDCIYAERGGGVRAAKG